MNDVQPVCGANGLTYFSPCHAGELANSLIEFVIENFEPFLSTWTHHINSALPGCTTGGDNFTNCACVLGGQSHSSSPDPFSGANPLHGGANTLSQKAAENHDNDFQEVTMIPVATSGPCYSQCQMIMPFMVLLFFMTLVVAVTQMPVLMVVLR